MTPAQSLRSTVAVAVVVTSLACMLACAGADWFYL